MQALASAKNIIAAGVALICACLLSAPVRAAAPEQAGDREMEELGLFYAREKLVYSVSKRPEQYLEAPFAVSVVTAEDIRYSGAKKITDVFRMVPGVDVADINCFYTGVQSRGFSFIPKYAREMLVLIDGRSVYTPEINATFWDQLPLFLEDIERVEVVRGPNAALYGANAFNGVINIITKDPAATKGAFMSITAGNRQSQWETLRYGGTAGSLTYRITAGYQETDGFRKVYDHMRKPQVTVRGDYKIDADSLLSFQAGYAGGERELSRTVQPEVTSYFTMAKYERRLGTGNKVSLQYYHDFRNSEMSYGFPSKLGEDDVEVQFNREADQYHLVIGAGYRFDRVRHGYLSGRDYLEYAQKTNHDFHINTRNNHILKTFANGTWRLTPKLHLTGALMVENNEFVGTMTSPKASLVYLPVENQSLRCSISRAYRTPSFIEEKADFSVPVPALRPPYIGQQGNDRLKPERMVAYELGYRGVFLAGRLQANLETFYHNINNIIVYTEDQPNIYRYRNFTTNHVRGLEASCVWQATDWWRLSLAYTYQKATDDYLKGLVIKNKFIMGNRFKLPWGVMANFQLYFVDDVHFEEDAWVPRSTVKDYTRFDMRFSKTFLNERMEIAFIGQNLFDPKHYEYPATLSAGEAYRSCMLEVSFRFGGD